MRSDRMVIGIAVALACAWCGWISGFHRETAAAEVTWVISLLVVLMVDVALWQGSKGGRLGIRLRPVDDPWPRQDGNGRALRGVAPWLSLLLVVLAWEILGIDSGPHQYHLTVSALAQAYRPLNAALLLVWFFVGIGYEAARVRAPIGSRVAGPPERPPPAESGGTFVVATGSIGVHHAGPGLLLPQNPHAGVAFWIAVPLAAILIDWSARRSSGRRANVEEFIRFVSTNRLVNYALIAAWTFAGYHLFAR